MTSSARARATSRESSCCSRWPEVIACFSASRFSPSSRSSREVCSLISRPSVRTQEFRSRAGRASNSFEQPHHIAQFALHRKRTFAALLAAGDGHVVKAFARLREKNASGSHSASSRPMRRVGHDVAVAAALAESLPAICQIHRARESCSSAGEPCRSTGA